MLKPIPNGLSMQELLVRGRRGQARRDVREFEKSNVRVCLVDGWQDTYANVRTAYVAYTNEARSAGSGIRVIKRGDNIYMAKENG